MAKTKEEIQELMASGLFQSGIDNQYISIDVEDKLILYHCRNDKRGNLDDDLEIVRAKAYLLLITHYHYSQRDISFEETLSKGQKKFNADIIVYEENSLKPLIVVECKKEQAKENLFFDAEEQMLKISKSMNCRYVWATSGIRNEYYETSPSISSGMTLVADIPCHGGNIEKAKYVRGKNEPLTVSKEEMKLTFKAAYDNLWRIGSLAHSTAFNELNKLIFCKIYDEKSITDGEAFSFQVLPETEDKDDTQRSMTKSKLENRVRSLYERGRKEYPGMFNDDIKLDKNKIYTAVQCFQDVNITATKTEDKNVAYLSLLEDYFRGELGLSFTPKPIAEFITNSIESHCDWNILDTSCGSGGFLQSLTWKMRYTGEEARKHLYGIEINEQMSRIAKMNLLISGYDNINIITNDALKNSRTLEIENRNTHFQDGTFDLILTHPPFGTKVKANSVNYSNEYELFEKNLGFTVMKTKKADDDKKDLRESQSIEALLIERCYRYLREGGSLVTIVPDSLLANIPVQYVRDWLVTKFRILAVVSLPAHALGTRTKCSVLYLKKHPESVRQMYSQILYEVKQTVKSEKIKGNTEKANRMLELYRDRISQLIYDYKILMVEITDIGYDESGRNTDSCELQGAARKINEFISNAL